MLHSRQAPPYPPNLTPTPSTLRPHCTASDHLEWWLPHPDALTPPDSAVPPELQGRVKAVTLQGWADSTHTTYSTGLLIYHVFCDHSKIPEVDQAPASAMLILSFVSTLVGSLLSKAICNYIYGVRAWHTFYGLPWVLHEEQIATMLKGAAKLAPRPSNRTNASPSPFR